MTWETAISICLRRRFLIRIRAGLDILFELPQNDLEGIDSNTYEVTVAFKHWWDERWVNISLEGKKTVATDIELGYGEWVCKTFTAEVTDGVLECRSRKPEKKQQQAGSGLKLH